MDGTVDYLPLILYNSPLFRCSLFTLIQSTVSMDLVYSKHWFSLQ